MGQKVKEVTLATRSEDSVNFPLPPLQNDLPQLVLQPACFDGTLVYVVELTLLQELCPGSMFWP